MSNQFLRGHYLGFLVRYQMLEVCVPGNEEVTSVGAAVDEYFIRMRDTVSQGSYPWEQSFGLSEIHRQDPQMVPDSFELRSSVTIGNGSRAGATRPLSAKVICPVRAVSPF